MPVFTAVVTHVNVILLTEIASS